MEQLISMYAALQEYPVALSYPDGQIYACDFNHAHGYDHDFTTIYTFGPYKLEHTSVSRSQQLIKGYSEELVFTKLGTTSYKTIRVTKRLFGLDKDYVALSNAVRAKSDGKKFENPFEKIINDSVYDLQFYLTELMHADDKAIKNNEIQETIDQLDKIKKRLLLTQNINYSEQNKAK